VGGSNLTVVKDTVNLFIKKSQGSSRSIHIAHRFLFNKDTYLWVRNIADLIFLVHIFIYLFIHKPNQKSQYTALLLRSTLSVSSLSFSFFSVLYILSTIKINSF
jgi:hypothetical protein